MSAAILLMLVVFFAMAVGVTVLRGVWMLMDRSLSSGSEPNRDNALLAQVREELEAMSGRLSRMEEEMDFFKELHAPPEQRRIGGPEDEDASDDAE